MKMLEIITLCSAQEITRSVISELLKQIEKADAAERPAGIKIYHHADVDNVSIHIKWESVKGSSACKTPIGLMLSHTLREYGLLNHSLWIEEETQDY